MPEVCGYRSLIRYYGTYFTLDTPLCATPTASYATTAPTWLAALNSRSSSGRMRSESDVVLGLYGCVIAACGSITKYVSECGVTHIPLSTVKTIFIGTCRDEKVRSLFQRTWSWLVGSRASARCFLQGAYKSLATAILPKIYVQVDSTTEFQKSIADMWNQRIKKSARRAKAQGEVALIPDGKELMARIASAFSSLHGEINLSVIRKCIVSPKEADRHQIGLTACDAPP